MGSSLKSAQFLAENGVNAGQLAANQLRANQLAACTHVNRQMDDAARGNANAAYDLGIAYSTGTSGVSVNLVEAHKWFNIAALRGNAEAPYMRAEVAEEMSAREIIEAQKMARAWLARTATLAA